MSQNKSQTAPSQAPPLDQMESQSTASQSQQQQPDGFNSDILPIKEEKTVPLHETPEFQDAVAKAVAAAMENAKKKEEETAAEAAKVAEAEKAKAAEVVDMTQPLYGNQDKKKEFNIRDLNPLVKLPDDKVVALKRTFYTSPSGVVKEDENLREIQFYNLLDFEAWSKTSEQNGLSVFQVIEPNLLVLHKPTGKK